MIDQPTIYSFNYKPGRSVDELEEERVIQNISLSYEERFRKMMALIRVTLKLKVNSIDHVNRAKDTTPKFEPFYI